MILIIVCLKIVRIVIIISIMLKFINFSLKFIIIFFVFSTLWYFSVGLPDYKKLSNYQPPISSRVYSEDKKLIAEYAIEKRLFIPFESIPDKVVNAFLSAEDKNFFKHPGIDAKGILRAIIKNIITNFIEKLIIFTIKIIYNDNSDYLWA